ncbi:XkdW family protein [Paenibacillus apii]|uniref:XkdW family protein n=1 Tax=Paenibacillus apii TaxID=1850370 RepID=UPI00143BDDAA|nr:XkdW family protein [Paenibacillus apii]NJJ37812.1 phage portal protein [Paenibacillus apii]
MNISKAIQHLYPDVDVMKDFEVWDNADGNGPYIAVWNLKGPQPTEEELQAAWEAYQQAEANKPPVETDAERMSQLEQENKLLKAQNAALSDRADFIEDVIAEMAMQVYQ